MIIQQSSRHRLRFEGSLIVRADLSGKVAFITGAAGGIGSAIAELFAANGAAIVAADLNEAGAKALAERLPRAIAIGLDIRNEAEINRGVDETLTTYGHIDILINNAGVNTLAHRVDIDAFPVEEWRRIVDIDLDGTYLVSRIAVQPMIRQKRGRIINIASTVGLAALRLQSPFVAAKAAVIHLTRSMALELSPKGILVNAIAPGSTLTEVTRKLFYGVEGSFHERAAAFMKHVPLGRPAEPKEIAQGALFLASDASSYVNGHCLTIDGGWTAGYMM
jgi:NAD(P)-dependent dehydrogenase (short-subunit alcohol dehydrogenase family)